MNKVLVSIILCLTLQSCDDADRHMTKGDVDRIISDYYIKNPEALQASLDNLAKFQKEAEDKKYQTTLEQYNLNKLILNNDTFYGSMNTKKS